MQGREWTLWAVCFDCTEGVQLHGGYGYLMSNTLELSTLIQQNQLMLAWMGHQFIADTKCSKIVLPGRVSNQKHYESYTKLIRDLFRIFRSPVWPMNEFQHWQDVPVTHTIVNGRGTLPSVSRGRLVAPWRVTVMISGPGWETWAGQGGDRKTLLSSGETLSPGQPQGKKTV